MMYFERTHGQRISFIQISIVFTSENLSKIENSAHSNVSVCPCVDGLRDHYQFQQQKIGCYLKFEGHSDMYCLCVYISVYFCMLSSSLFFFGQPKNDG